MGPVKASSYCSAAIVRSVPRAGPRTRPESASICTATNMFVSHFSFLSCPHLLFNHSPRPHLFLKASNCTRFPLYLSTLRSPVWTYGLTNSCGVEPILPSSGLHLIEHDVVCVSIYHLSLHSPHLFGEGAFRGRTFEFNPTPVIGARSARFCLPSILFRCSLHYPLHNDPAHKALVRELHFTPATRDGNSLEVWAHAKWFFELLNARHARRSNPVAPRLG